MDLPGELVSTDNYCATLGHKINHNFNYNCTEWFCQHPRHGLIPCITAVTDIPQARLGSLILNSFIFTDFWRDLKRRIKILQIKLEFKATSISFTRINRVKSSISTMATIPATVPRGMRSSYFSSCPTILTC